MSSASPIIDFRKVDFSYGDHPLFKDFSFQVQDNQLIALLGPNGAGKSTFLKLILGLLSPQKGDIRILEHAPGSSWCKQHISSALQELHFPPSEKVHEILRFVATQYSQSDRPQQLIEDFLLSDFANKSCGELSGGMRRRLALACAFVGIPKIVVLDEPSTGLDIESRKNLIKNLKSYQQKNKALVIMITHHPDEIIDSVDQFLHIKKGRIQTLTKEKMQKLTSFKTIKFRCSKTMDLPTAQKTTITGNEVSILTDNGDKYVRSLIAEKIPFQDLRIRKAESSQVIEEVL